MTDDVNTNAIEQQLLRAVPVRAPVEMREYQLAELQRPTPRAITDTVEMIASVTDEETGRWFEEHLIALRASRRSRVTPEAMQRAVNEILETWNLPRKDS